MSFWAHENGQDLSDARDVICTCGAIEKNLLHSGECLSFKNGIILDRVARLCYKLRTGKDSVIQSD